MKFIASEEQQTTLFFLSDSHLPWPRISILRVFSSLCDMFVLETFLMLIAYPSLS